MNRKTSLLILLFLVFLIGLVIFLTTPNQSGRLFWVTR
jgi:hypothetical protein